MKKFLTLDESNLRYPEQYLDIPGFFLLLRDIAMAAVKISAAVKTASLNDMLGEQGDLNIQEERVQKLDAYANTQCINILQGGKHCAGIASEELPDFLAFSDPACRRAAYVCLFDPIDGSGNIDVNNSIGTIFSVYERLSPLGSDAELRDFLQPGSKQLAAGYILYGFSTMLVYATEKAVHGFTLDEAPGEFRLTHPFMQCPEKGSIYSVNHGHFFRFGQPVQDYILHCQRISFGDGSSCTHRYTGSMVSDMHRVLLKGGLFMYPSTEKKLHGKLRLMYECNPFAFIMKAAGGFSINGQQNILDIIPASLHQRTPFFSGSREMRVEWEKFMGNN